MRISKKVIIIPLFLTLEKLTGSDKKSITMIPVIFHRLGPYHFARLRAAGRQLPVTALETSSTDNTYAWDLITGADGFERVTLFENGDVQSQSSKEIVQRLTTALDKINPRVVVVPGWADAAALGALQWCSNHRVPSVIMSESNSGDESRSHWREFVKRQIVSLGAAGLVGGTPHAEYLARLGMPLECIFLGYDAVDNDFFADQAAKVRNKNPEAKRRHDLPDNFFLASNRFICKKNLLKLIEAYALYRQESAGSTSKIWDLVLLGDGELRPELEQLIAAHDLKSCVRLPGFKQYADLPAYYANAGAFIHASTTEQWGLVVNEAMASGLPVLVSNRCGCAADLVQPYVNGFTFHPAKVEQLAQRMLQMWRLPPETRKQMGEASQEIISDWGPKRFADGLKAATEKALAVGPKKASLIQRGVLNTLLSRNGNMS